MRGSKETDEKVIPKLTTKLIHDANEDLEVVGDKDGKHVSLGDYNYSPYKSHGAPLLTTLR
ncbi:hypothetical protein MSG28_001723 [Choristoneura fumiferana]|uniref:Uncharacterized protein n=1 Tax=Choristoneura fumiferana TaxID=7141 RepID=A0ACC0KUX2_CHOFU|nr:hypothetical protein MSG28_001723 [Choristoneura fumiferana]